MAVAPISSNSRITCCCGKISRPLGAALSIGITKTTVSLGFTISFKINFSCVFLVNLSELRF